MNEPKLNWKVGDPVFCCNEATFSTHLTKRNSYLISDIDFEKSQTRIKSDTGKLVWIPLLCFQSTLPPTIISVTIDDEIIDARNACIEITVKFSNGDRGFTTIMTLGHLNNLFSELREFVLGDHLVFVQEVNTSTVHRIIDELDRTNQLRLIPF